MSCCSTASGSCFASLALLPLLSDQLRYLPLIPQTLALNAGLFFLPSCLLGMVTPLASKQALTTLGTAGGVVGRLYAVSTAGSILGVYLTGFVLVALLGTRHVVLLAGLILLALALLLGHAHTRPGGFAGLALLPTVGLLGYALQPHLRLGPCNVETHYYCVQVEQVEFPGGPVKFIKLDHLVHGLTVVGDPDAPRLQLHPDPSGSGPVPSPGPAGAPGRFFSVAGVTPCRSTSNGSIRKRPSRWWK